MTGQPYTFEQARGAAAAASAGQLAAERAMKEAAKDFAQKEQRYRVALAKEIVRQHAEDKVAWTVAPDLARSGSSTGVPVHAACCDASRRSRATSTSPRVLAVRCAPREIAEGYGQAPEPEFTAPIGGRG